MSRLLFYSVCFCWLAGFLGVGEHPASAYAGADDEASFSYGGRRFFVHDFIPSDGRQAISKPCASEVFSIKSFDGLSIEVLRFRSVFSRITGNGSRAAVLIPMKTRLNRASAGIHQILCHLGYEAFAVHVRGATGFGEEFASLDDGDLNGRDYEDLVAAHKYVVHQLNFRSSRVGVLGSSELVPWALTRPKGVFAFGVAIGAVTDYGRASLEPSLRDYVAKNLGEPNSCSALYVTRSPIAYVDYVQEPLLLVHGSEDTTVGVEHSREFVAKARDAGRAIDYLEILGEGREFSGVSSYQAYYQRLADFLWKHAPLK